MIYAKFLRSLRNGNSYFKLVWPAAYYEVYHAYLATLLARPQAIISLAVLSDDSDVVIAWALSEPNKLHYVWVDKDMRKKGVATALVQPFETITHLTNTALTIWNNKFPNARFNPFA